MGLGMAINFPCPWCSVEITAGNNHAGKASNCPKCGMAVDIPTVLDTQFKGQSINPIVLQPFPNQPLPFQSSPIQPLGPPSPYHPQYFPEIPNQRPRPQAARPQNSNLIGCPGCERPVSRQANSCPGCGHVLQATAIEKTGRKWKAYQAFGLLCAVVGSVPLFSGSKDVVLPIMCFFFGFVCILVGKLGAWWYHG